MQILIACAKLMTTPPHVAVPFSTEPVFGVQASDNALQMAACTADQLQAMLGVNRDIAVENWQRYQSFFDNSARRPAAMSYDGMVFRKLSASTLTSDELAYANDHLLIASFLYGMLRPLDMINAYRLEGNVMLPDNGGATMFDFWKPLLTGWFIDKVKADDGILVNLASNEFRNMFDWRRVKKELTVITPEFKVEKNGSLKTIVIYTKMCRGAMTRWILQNRPTSCESLRHFAYEGFAYDHDWLFALRDGLPYARL